MSYSLLARRMAERSTLPRIIMLADMSMEPDGVELAEDVESMEPEDEVAPAAAFSSSSLRFLRLLLDEEDERLLLRSLRLRLRFSFSRAARV